MAGNLEFITSSEVTSSVTSYSLDNIFSADYDVYQIVLRNFTYTSTATWINLRFLDSGGSVISTANYDWAMLNMNAGGAFAEYRGTNATNITYSGNYTSSSSQGNTQVLTVYNPFDSGSYTFTNSQDCQFSTNIMGNRKIGVLKIAGTHRGINLDTLNANAFNTGKISVYGVK